MAENSAMELFLLLTERFVKQFGAPLPKRLLSIGDPDKGWGAQLNPTNAKAGDIEPFHAVVTWNGWPAALLCPAYGEIVAGEAANTETLCQWLREFPSPEAANA